MSLLATITELPVRVRRLTARHRWVRAVVPVLLGLATFSLVERADDAAAGARDEWGERVTVWVAAATTGVGDSLRADQRDIPAWLVPEGAAAAARDVVGLTSRRPIGLNEIIVDADLDERPVPLALVPDGWLAVPVVESPPSGADIGEAVVVVSDGVVLTADAIVLEPGGDGGRTLIAVPEDDAPIVAFAASPAGPGVGVLRTGR